ncbi:MAG: sulfite exporter TauE/SafE family protein [Patescibacteria group bacterium]|jgi:sulfite exporter TauE/SafE/copper chaperone CopZ
MSNIKIPIQGMHCASCEILIGDELKKIAGVKKVDISHKTGEAKITFEGTEPKKELLEKAVGDAGYKIGINGPAKMISSNPADYKNLIKAALVLFVIYLLAKWFNLTSLNIADPASGGIAVALLVGLVAGVSTCMALVGGLILSLSARHAELHPESTAYEKFRPHLFFNLGRIGGYALLGGLIGMIGSAVRPSSNFLGFMTVVIGAVMLFFGLKLIEIFPILRDKNITLPTSVAKFFGISSNVKEYSHKGAMVAGALTFFVPCGFTQAMQLYAVSSGSFSKGMMIMGLFAIGTAPGLLGIGGLTSIFKGKKAKLAYITAGLAVILLGWTNIANGMRLFGTSSKNVNNAVTEVGGEQVVNMTESGRGYSPNVFTVQKGKPVKWVINATSVFSCASTIVMPKFGIYQSLSSGENIIRFTPAEVGEIPFSCSMGMYNGKFIVVEESGYTGQNQVASNNYQQPAEQPSFGGGCGMMRARAQTQNFDAAPTAETATQGGEQVINTSYTLNKDIVPSNFTVKVNQPVKFVVDVQEDGQGCMSTIMVPGLYDQAVRLQAGRTIQMAFTPTRTGKFEITCAMGVPRGVINVVD